MNFSDKTKKRLENFKATIFPNLGNGQWKKNKKYYPHILPEDSKLYNLLPTYRDVLIEYINKQHIKLHSDFHHLNSSQAMCLNFFFPFFKEKQMKLITDFIGFSDETIDYNTVAFEKHGLEAKLRRRPTYFDFYFETTSGKKLYFEIKYTEGSFGKAIVNSNKFDNVYSKFLKPLNNSFHSEQEFFNNFQILRNLIHIDDNSFVVFVYPQDNRGIRRDAERVKSDFLNSTYHNNFFSVTWEMLFESVYSSTKNTTISKQLDDFKAKYLPEQL
jgi:hypothetical protein